MSKAQGKFDFSVHHPFKIHYILLTLTDVLIMLGENVLRSTFIEMLVMLCGVVMLL